MRRWLTRHRREPTITLGPLVVHVFAGAGGEMQHPDDRAHPDEWGGAHIPARDETKPARSSNL